MIPRFRLKACMLFVGILLLAEGEHFPVGGTPIGGRTRGRATFEQYCSICHGPRGLGDGPMAKASTPAASNVTTPEIRQKTDDELFAAIADGKGSGMPAWRGLLTDQEIRDVVAYLRALGG